MIAQNRKMNHQLFNVEVPLFPKEIVASRQNVNRASVKSRFDPFLSQYPEPYRGRMKQFAV